MIRFQIPTAQPGPAIITLTSGEIAITDSVTITGNNATAAPPSVPSPLVIINGNHASRIFNVGGPGVLTVNFYGLGLTAGKASASPAGVPASGGAVLNAAANVTFVGCTLTDNSADGNGGAIETISPISGTYGSQRVVSLSYCRVMDNHATDGGTLHFTGPAATLTVTSSSFTGNSSTAEGWRIEFAYGGRATIDASTLAYNSAGTSGGGLYYVAGPNILPPTTTNPLVLVRNSTFSGNGAKVSGGAISLASFSNGQILIANSTVTHNTAGVNSPILTNSGGGIHVASGSSTSIGQVSLVSSIVSQNHAIFGPDIFTPGVASSTSSALGNNSGIGTYVDGGNNLPFGIDLKLGPLANNGGPTQTHLPAADSPVINHGSNPYNLHYDQRGYPFRRVVGMYADIGAVERPGPNIFPFRNR